MIRFPPRESHSAYHETKVARKKGNHETRGPRGHHAQKVTGVPAARVVQLQLGVDAALLAFLKAFVPTPQTTTEVLASLTRIEQQLGVLMSKTDDLSAALDRIDAVTTKMGTTEQTIADGLQKVSDEMDGFAAQLKNVDGVPQSLVDKANGFADHIQGVSDFMDSQAAALKALVAKGDPNAIPTAPEAPQLAQTA